jgi:hypothetical protein
MKSWQAISISGLGTSSDSIGGDPIGLLLNDINKVVKMDVMSSICVHPHIDIHSIFIIDLATENILVSTQIFWAMLEKFGRQIFKSSTSVVTQKFSIVRWMMVKPRPLI